jgi:concanavalin A-like lectin/glucanase superfamily protein
MKRASEVTKALFGGVVVLLLVFAPAGPGLAQTCVESPVALSRRSADSVSGTTAFDTVGGHDGTMVGGVGIVPGMVGNAFSFDGVDDYIEVADSPAWDLKDFTVAAWIKTSAVSLDFRRIISHQETFGNHWGMRQEGAFLGIHSSLDGIGVFHAGPAINDGEFHHVAAVRDTAAGHWFLYVDGVQFVGPSATNATFNIAEKLQIGRYVGGSEFWQGVLDEVAIYRRALSASEIQAIKNFSTPISFATFAPKVKILLGSGTNDDTFDLSATFTLGATSDLIFPLTEDVVLRVGVFSTVIPAGSFRADGQGRFSFDGVVGGVTLEVLITPSGRATYRLSAKGEGANLAGSALPLSVGLTICNDGGTVSLGDISAK